MPKPSKNYLRYHHFCILGDYFSFRVTQTFHLNLFQFFRICYLKSQVFKLLAFFTANDCFLFASYFFETKSDELKWTRSWYVWQRELPFDEIFKLRTHQCVFNDIKSKAYATMIAYNLIALYSELAQKFSWSFKKFGKLKGERLWWIVS